MVALTTVLASCAAPAVKTAPQAAETVTGTPVGAHESGGEANDEESWAVKAVAGLPAGSALWDVAVDDSGGLVAVGTVETDDPADDDVPLLVWRSPEGLFWHQAFRYPDDLGYDSAFVGVPRAAITAQGDGFAIVASRCPDRCFPLALYSPDGSEWTEVEVPVRPPPSGEAMRAPSGGGGAGAVSPVGVTRLLLGTPGYTIEGAAMLDVVATPGRLVAVGWAEVGKYTTAGAVWLSDDGGRTWRQVPEAAIPQPNPYRDQLDKVVVAGDRVVASGGNRCCYDQSVGGVWVSDAAGERWRYVALPGDESVGIADIAASGHAVHVVGRVGEFSEPRVQWRLSGEGVWERLPATPLPGRLLAHPGGLLVVDTEAPTVAEQRRLTLFHSPDGKRFRISRASHPREGLELELALIFDGRLLAYATAGREDDQRRFLFEGSADGAEPQRGSAVWAGRFRPSPVLFGEAVRVPDEEGLFVDVTPPQTSAADLVVDAFFLDPDHGWALLADSETQTRRLTLTTDGGKHWAPGGFGPSPETARWLFFLDRKNGWIVAYSDSGTYPKASLLYRTTDGGETWTDPSPLPTCGPVHFDTPQHGWLADPGRNPAGCGLDHLFETTDGGSTWTKRDPARQRSGEPLSAGYGPPRFESSILPAWLMENSNRATFFKSADGGRAWTLSGSVEYPRTEPNNYPQASIAEKRVWWAADSEGTVLSVTTDGGVRWREVRPVGIRGRLVSLEAIDERRAWAVEANAEGVRLMSTDDGGGHWHSLLKE
jgi:photosystem II stability/assembly factor-like uncharacterized protein